MELIGQGIKSNMKGGNLALMRLNNQFKKKLKLKIKEPEEGKEPDGEEPE
jgi:hypothetical protein